VAQVFGVNVFWIHCLVSLALDLFDETARLGPADEGRCIVDLRPVPAPELVQLKLTNSMGVAHEHFEPGQEIFHQGDLVIRIYIIARVTRKSCITKWERYFVSRLGPGDTRRDGIAQPNNPQCHSSMPGTTRCAQYPQTRVQRLQPTAGDA